MWSSDGFKSWNNISQEIIDPNEALIPHLDSLPISENENVFKES